jgi:hypothetical protein
MKQQWKWLALGVSCLCAGALLRADTLVMRDGRRVEGELIGVRDGLVEFEARRGSFSRERLRVDREDILRIDFEDRRGRSTVDRDTSDRRDDRPAGRPSGMREKEVSVDSWLPMKDTGVELRAGQTVYFSATGRVRWGPNRQDGPAGERNSPRNDARPMPSRSAAALIGRVGVGDDYFFIGDDEAAIQIRGSGRLHLGVNDDFLTDNTGSFRVTVYY